MRLKTPADIGIAIRTRRLAMGLDQAALAARIGATRQWVIAVEKGHPRAALGLVLRALTTVGVALESDTACAAPAPPSTPDIDAIVVAATKRGR